MITKQLYNNSGKQIGYEDEKHIYRKEINFKTQMFHSFQESIGLSLSVIKSLHKDTIFHFYIYNYPNEEPFIAIISLREFVRNSEEYHRELMKTYRKDNVILTPYLIKFVGKKNCDFQRLTPLKYFKRYYYKNQKTLEI